MPRSCGGDCRQPEAVAAAVRRLRPTVIVNAAAYTAVDQAEREPALAQFQKAQQLQADTSNSDKWRDLIASTRYWLVMEQADAALEAAAVALGATAPVAALEPPLRKSVAYQPEPLS